MLDVARALGHELQLSILPSRPPPSRPPPPVGWSLRHVAAVCCAMKHRACVVPTPFRSLRMHGSARFWPMRFPELAVAVVSWRDLHMDFILSFAIRSVVCVVSKCSCLLFWLSLCFFLIHFRIRVEVEELQQRWCWQGRGRFWLWRDGAH